MVASTGSRRNVRKSFAFLVGGATIRNFPEDPALIITKGVSSKGMPAFPKRFAQAAFTSAAT